MRLLTIGHSNHEAGAFLALLARHGVTAVADVRSAPYSRFNPHFNRENLQRALFAVGVAYVYLGRELGARREERECYVAGVARYERIARTPAFADGVERVLRGMGTHRVALMCAEKDPLTCHRTILVARHMRPLVDAIDHIREDGSIETTAALESRLVRMHFPDGRDLFRDGAALTEAAYEMQAEGMQYAETPASDAPASAAPEPR